jgi:hypothetical protein
MQRRPGLTRDRPKKLLETIKGVSEQKATKILVEGKNRPNIIPAPADLSFSLEACTHGLYHRDRDARSKI